MNEDHRQKPMSAIAFRVMELIMSIRKRSRNLEEEIGLAGIKEGDSILDLGCGPGFNTIPAAQKVGNRGKVFALDISPKAIETIEKKMKEHKLTNIRTILSDGDTGLKSGSIDLVYLHNTLPLIKNKKKVLNEIYRVLKVNGRLSYMSRGLSRIASENSMTDEEVKRYLELENRFRSIKSKKQHFIFEKIKK